MQGVMDHKTASPKTHFDDFASKKTNLNCTFIPLVSSSKPERQMILNTPAGKPCPYTYGSASLALCTGLCKHATIQP